MGAELRLVPKEHGASFMSVHSLLLGIVAGMVLNGLQPGIADQLASTAQILAGDLDSARGLAIAYD